MLCLLHLKIGVGTPIDSRFDLAPFLVAHSTIYGNLSLDIQAQVIPSEDTPKRLASDFWRRYGNPPAALGLALGSGDVGTSKLTPLQLSLEIRSLPEVVVQGQASWDEDVQILESLGGHDELAGRIDGNIMDERTGILHGNEGQGITDGENGSSRA